MQQEQRRKAWLDDRQPNVVAEAHDSHAAFPGNSGRAAEANQPRSVVKAGFSKIYNFDRPLSKPDMDQLVTPWRATVRKGDLQQSLEEAEPHQAPGIHDATSTLNGARTSGTRTVADLTAFWGRNVKAAARHAGSKHNLSKVEAQAALQRQITSGSKVDWNEVRNLRKIIAESDDS